MFLGLVRGGDIHGERLPHHTRLVRGLVIDTPRPDSPLEVRPLERNLARRTERIDLASLPRLERTH
jgi:hypothetical protein